MDVNLKVNNNRANRNQIQHPDMQKAQMMKAIEKIAGSLEANFVNLLVKEMKKTVPINGEKSQATGIYESMLDEERSRLVSQTKSGLGIKKIIMDQMVPSRKIEHFQRPNPLAEYQKHNDPQVRE